MKRIILLLVLVVLIGTNVNSQVERKDKAIFVQPKNAFMDSIKKSLEAFYKKEEKAKKQIKMDFNAVDYPKSVDEFKKYWHHTPISQGISGMCWCYSTTSFYESEIYRLTKRQIKLSELYTVYWEFVEKARRFVRERGNSEFGEGSEANAVKRIWKMYGIVPVESYNGIKSGQPFHDHSKMFAEMKNYLQSLKNSNEWNEDASVSTIKSILNHYIGEPPQKISVEGKQLTPKEYLEKVVRLNLDEYTDLLSLMEKPYYEMVELEVPDNWWHSKEYYNIPLDKFISVLKKSIREGFTVCIGGDVSEPGIDGNVGIAVVPTFDIPPDYIDENARQYRFSNKTTTDDHGVHVVGFVEKDGKDWYLIKDSGSGSRNNNHPGYYFYHEDFVKLKMLSILVHKSVMSDTMK